MPHTLEKRATTLLKERQLRITGCRMEALRIFLQNGFALSQPDLEKALGELFDRVTIYRTLTSFLESGLIHKVLDDSGASKFALCHHHHTEAQAHADEHIHFKCVRCSNTHCLDGLPFPSFKAPQQYTFLDTNVLIQGICPNCQQ